MFSAFTPLSSPTAIFTLIICIIMLVPYLAKRLRIPSIFGLILAGLVIGPHGSGLLHTSEGVSIMANVGLLYIMFLAGLDIDLNVFLRNKYHSLFFGAATFFIPLILGFVVLRFALHFDLLPALLVASMFSTHTLLSYPIASRLNLVRRESVVITIGGTIITDTAVLVLLSIITASYTGKLDGLFWLQLLGFLVLFLFVVLWGLPRVARWFFNTIQTDSIQQYLFVLVALFLSAMLGKAAGIEPIVGAFLSGLALNQVIPHDSSLMHRTKFVGNSLFIPFFLISVGMLVNLRVLFNGIDTLILALVLTSVAIAGKFLAAWVTQLRYRYSRADRNLIFGLSASHAAATIAVIMVGFQLGILDEKVLNGTILLILVTSIVSSFVTESAGRAVAIEEADLANDMDQESESILVPCANPDTLNILLSLAKVSRIPRVNSAIYPLTIVTDNENASQALMDSRKHLSKLASKATADLEIVPITRLDINIPTGISSAVKEFQANKIILGWSGRSFTTNYFFGNIIDTILENTQQMVWVVKLNTPVTKFRNIFVMVPTNAEREIGFFAWISSINALADKTGGKVIILAGFDTNCSLQKRLTPLKAFSGFRYENSDDYPDTDFLQNHITEHDLLVMVTARPSTISYSRRQIVIPRIISRMENINFVVIYPEQISIPDMQ